MCAKVAFPITRIATRRPARATRSLRASAPPDFSCCSNKASASAELWLRSKRLWYGSMPCERSVCSFCRRCSSCSLRSASIPRKSKCWLEDVERAALHWPIRPERISGRLQPPGDRVDGATTAANAAHDALHAVAGVDRQPGYFGRSQQRSSVGRVGVLAGLQPPGQLRRVPDVLPERNDTCQRVIACRIEETEGEGGGSWDIVERRLGRRRGGPEGVGSAAGGPPVGAGFELDRHRRLGGHLAHGGDDQPLPA